MKNSGILEKKDWSRLYKMVKGGFFRSRAHLKLYIEKEGLVKNVTGEKK
jgi:ribosomal protein L19E